MDIITSLRPIAAPHGSAVALGFFDGVHLGHRRVLGAAVRWAAENGCTPAAFTFLLPMQGGFKGQRLMLTGQKHRLISGLGIQQYMEPPFVEFCALTPEQFVEQVLVGCFAARAVFCGGNFTFGAKAAGNVGTLQALCAARGIAVQVVDMARYQGLPVSSSRIRAALAQGQLEDANAMLGAPYTVVLPVIHGKGVGTSRLGTPTLNQAYPDGALVPAQGVYLSRVWLQGRWWPAATGISTRPTVDGPGAPVSCETYVPGFAGDAYGQAPALELHRYYGPIQRFDTLAELRALILQAGEASTAYFAAKVG